MDDILVSINCTAYNHEEYIADAIEGFLKQKTNFHFEILIHDDASTDRTADIIRDYEKKYPNLIKPIYQKENQYSQGHLISNINLERAKGKYVAICEGDDYWIDPFKLQKQVDYMEEHPECSLCVHGGYIVDAQDKKTIFKHRISRSNRIFSVEEVIEGGGGLFLTNSMLYPRKYESDLPEFYKMSPVGDYPFAIHLSLRGTVYYMDEPMSAYRTGVTGSWTSMNMSNLNQRIEHYQEIGDMLDELNNYTEEQFAEAISRKKCHNRMILLIEQRKFREIKSGENKEYYLSLGFKSKLVIFLEHYFPILLQLIRMARRRWLKWTIT